jgi:peptidyl-prolyl cis-trans isomerase C
MRAFLALLLTIFVITGCTKPKATTEAPAPPKKEAKPAAAPAAAPAAEQKPAAKPETTAPAKGETPPAAGEAPAEDIPDPVALVNGEAISAKTFTEALSRYQRPKLKIPPDRLKRLKTTILDRLIDDILVSQVVKKEGITVPREKLEKEFEEYKKRFKTPKQYTNYLEHSRMTEERVRRQIAQRLEFEALLDKKGTIKVEDNEAKEFYEKHQNLYKERETVHAAHILARVAKDADDQTQKSARAKLTKAQAEIKKGRSFEDVAKEISEGPSAPRGGDLGYFGRGQMVKEFEEVAFSLKPGKVSKPVRTAFGWHLIKVMDKKKGRTRDLEEVKDQLVESLRRKKFAKEKRKVLKDLHKEAKIEKKLTP